MAGIAGTWLGKWGSLWAPRGRDALATRLETAIDKRVTARIPAMAADITILTAPPTAEQLMAAIKGALQSATANPTAGVGAELGVIAQLASRMNQPGADLTGRLARQALAETDALTPAGQAQRLITLHGLQAMWSGEPSGAIARGVAEIARVTSDQAGGVNVGESERRALATGGLTALTRFAAADGSTHGRLASQMAAASLKAMANQGDSQAAKRLLITVQGTGYALRDAQAPATAALRGYAWSALHFVDGSVGSPALKQAWFDAYVQEMQAVITLSASEVSPALTGLIKRVGAVANTDAARKLQQGTAGVVAILAMAGAPAGQGERAAMDALATRATAVIPPGHIAIGPEAQWVQAYRDTMADLARFRAPTTTEASTRTALKKDLAARRLLAAADQLEALVQAPTGLTATAGVLLDHNADRQISAKELLGGLLHRRVAFDPANARITPVERAIAPDPAIMPGDVSRWFTDDKGHVSIEQCMEFLLRYFKERRAKVGLVGPSLEEDFHVQRDLSGDVRDLASGKQTKVGYAAYLNGGTRPPAPGSILSAKGPGGFHTALVTAVQAKGDAYELTLYQANVPLYTNSALLEDHLQRVTMEHQDGRWLIAPLQTSKQHYGGDMAVVGWIEPAPERGLQEAAEQTSAVLPKQTIVDALAVARTTLGTLARTAQKA